jgi:hypothetical protein
MNNFFPDVCFKKEVLNEAFQSITETMRNVDAINQKVQVQAGSGQEKVLIIQL